RAGGACFGRDRYFECDARLRPAEAKDHRYSEMSGRRQPASARRVSGAGARAQPGRRSVGIVVSERGHAPCRRLRRRTSTRTDYTRAALGGVTAGPVDRGADYALLFVAAVAGDSAGQADAGAAAGCGGAAAL